MGTSMPDEPGYQLNTNELGKNPLTDSDEVNFTIAELEVWLIEEVLWKKSSVTKIMELGIQKKFIICY